MTSRARALAAIVVVWCCTLAMARAAPAAAPKDPSGPPGARVTTTIQPLLVRLPDDPRSAKRAPNLTPEQVAKLREAQGLIESGMLEHARDLLVALEAQVPHHPLVLTELALVYLGQQNFAATEKLARAERAAAKDSLLLGRELVLAQERLGRPRDAVATALEMWVSTPGESEWAASTLLRLAPADSRGVLETLRKVAARNPGRDDLARGLAILEWRGGSLDAALRALAAADRSGRQPSWRSVFAEELLLSGASHDSLGAEEALLALAGDPARVQPERIQSSRRAWALIERRHEEGPFAPRLAKALENVPAAQWDSQVLLGVARGLREAGRTDAARTLLATSGAGDPALGPSVSLERALADLRDGPPARALAQLEQASRVSAEAAYRFADALFFAGLPDSALAKFQEVAKQPESPFAGAALERIYLIEDAEPRSALPAFGRLAYEDWRGNGAAAGAITDSLYRTLPRGPMWAQAALLLSARRERGGDPKSALAPVLAVADSLPDDRLAPVARQRAGDLYLKLKDETRALAQYEECLARYPRAWNSAEVRRHVEQLRRERRF
jgi:tetratricopeptide (TPR) repeat protein